MIEIALRSVDNDYVVRSEAKKLRRLSGDPSVAKAPSE